MSDEKSIGHDSRADAFIVREIGPEYLYNDAHQKTLDMTRAQNWLNLFCLGSFREGELDFCVWDAGYFNFLIHRDDLENSISAEFMRRSRAVRTQLKSAATFGVAALFPALIYGTRTLIGSEAGPVPWEPTALTRTQTSAPDFKFSSVTFDFVVVTEPPHTAALGSASSLETQT